MTERETVKVYAGGCFDMVHFGHANALRQASLMGSYLVVGAHCGKDISRNKRPPIYTDKERYRLIRNIKWVDEVFEAAPWYHSAEVLDSVGCDIIVHGDDPTVYVDGRDTYGALKQVGRYKEFKRTRGVSTTDVVERILQKDFQTISAALKPLIPEIVDHFSVKEEEIDYPATTSLLTEFSGGRSRKASDRVVYVSGNFDIFHVGHLAFLEKCAELGDYLIVGIHTDAEVKRQMGVKFPIMKLLERSLTTLAFKPVNEIVIGAPSKLTSDYLDYISPQVVAHGVTPLIPAADGSDPMQVAKEKGIYTEVDSGETISARQIVERIISRTETHATSNITKRAREASLVQKLEPSAKKIHCSS